METGVGEKERSEIDGESDASMGVEREKVK